MPPAVSDDESDIDVPDAIPARAKPVKANPEEDGEDDEDDEDEFQVETILEHKKKGNKIVYRVKWLGWDNPEDETWEPLDNLENAMEAVEKYHKAIGGTPEPPGKKGAKGAKAGKRASTAMDSPAQASGKKRARKSETNGASVKEDEFPSGTWEEELVVAAILEEEDPADLLKKQKDVKSLQGMVEWHNGRKTQHTMTVLRRKCPQRLLDYYESHLVFKGDPRYVETEGTKDEEDEG